MHKIIIDNVYLPYIKKDRTIRIYLPPHYDETQEHYPVIYMHDAQNLFDVNTSSYGAIWDVHTHLNTLYEATGKGLIVVGIDNYEGRHNRLDEYSPWVNTTLKTDDRFADITEDVGGLGSEYVFYLVHKLKPIIDKRYRTLPEKQHTAIIGSSMGGLISLYAGLKYPDIFTKIGAFSTAVWFAEASLLAYVEKKSVHHDLFWYLDVGTKESSPDENNWFNELYMSGTKKVHSTLSGLTNNDHILMTLDEGGIHNERDWSRRFQSAIEYLFKDYYENATV